MNILFVCTGNTCRSPMAEGMLRQLAEKQHLPIQVKSAGVAAYPGGKASQHTDAILKERGITEDHRSQPVTLELIDWANLILTMTMGHKVMLCQQFPMASSKIFTLKEYVGEPDSDIMDPYGGSLEVYKQTEKELERLFEKMKQNI